MKKVLIIVALGITNLVNAQQTEGKALYIESVDMSEAIEESNRQMDSAAKDNSRGMQMGAMKEQLNEFLKSFEKTEMELFFSKEAAVYKERQEELTAEEVNNEQNMFMRWKPEQDVNYTNLTEKRLVTTKDFMGKKFLIKQDQKDYKWKITGKQQVIAGYPSMQATYSDTSVIIEAWFTPQIPVSTGPRSLTGLPGLITKANIQAVITEEDAEKALEGEKKKGRGRMKRMMKMMQGNSNMTITLDKIEFKELSKSDLKEPKGGKVVTSEEEYTKIIQEKVKEMQANRGGHRGGKRR